MATVAEYLLFERASEARHEYVDGAIREMPPSSIRHSQIVTNIGCSLWAPLKDRPIGVLMASMRVRAGAGGPYYYPDVVISPEPPDLEDEQRDTLLNPSGVFEVTVPESEVIDRGEKLGTYAEIASLVDYVIVSRDRVRADHFSRQADGSWRVVIVTELDRSLFLPSIGVELPLAEVYDRVFPAGPEG